MRGRAGLSGVGGRRWIIVLVLGTVAIFMGCAGGNRGDTGRGAGGGMQDGGGLPSPVVPTASVTVRFPPVASLRAGEVWSGQVRFTGLDQRGGVQYPPVVRWSAPEVLLAAVPVTVVELRMELLAQSQVVDLRAAPLELLPGGCVVVADPARTAGRLEELSLSAPSRPVPVGDRARLLAHGIFTNGLKDDLTPLVRWRSATPATVDFVDPIAQPGALAAAAAGRARITATVAGVTGSVDVETSPISLVSIQVLPPARLAPGVRGSLRAVGRYSDCSTRDLTSFVTWGSLQPDIAAVGGTRVTGVAPGTATIVASWRGIEGGTPVRVKDARLVAIRVAPRVHRTPQRLVMTLRALGAFSDGTALDVSDSVTWESSTPDIAVPLAGSTIPGDTWTIQPGRARIVARIGDVSGSGRLAVAAASIRAVQVQVPSSRMPAGGRHPLRALALYDNGSRVDVTGLATWTPATSVETGTTPGILRARTAGPVALSARFGGVRGEATATLRDDVPTSIVIAPAGNWCVPAGGEQPLRATAIHSDGTASDYSSLVTWSTCDTSTATVIDGGPTTALLAGIEAGGPITLRATCAGVVDSARVTVTGDGSRSVLPLGPAPQGSGKWSAVFGNVSGRLTSVITTGGAIVVAAAGGGVWRTDDGCVSWSPVTDSQFPTPMGTLAVAPGDPTRVYAGTGEANSSSDSLPGCGILVSTDGARTFQLLAGSDTTFGGHWISSVAVDPGDAGSLLVGTAASSGDGRSPGLYQVDVQGVPGASPTCAPVPVQWAGTPPSNQGCTSVLITPDGTTAYAAMTDNARTGGLGTLYRGTRNGGSWTFAPLAGTLQPSGQPLPTDMGRVTLAVSPRAAGAALYALVARPMGGLMALYASLDGGSTWSILMDPTTPGVLDWYGNNAWYCNTLAVEAATASTDAIYIGGTDLGRALYDTSAGTVTVTALSNGQNDDYEDDRAHQIPAPDQPHVDHHALLMMGSRLLVGCDGGLYGLDNPSSATPDPVQNIFPTYVNLNGTDPAGRVLSTIQAYGIALHPTNPAEALVGSQDNGDAAFGGSLAWSTVQSGDGGLPRIDPGDPDTYYLEAQHDVKPSASGGPPTGTSFLWTTTGTGQPLVDLSASLPLGDTTIRFPAFDVVDSDAGHRVAVAMARIYEAPLPESPASWSPVSDALASGDRFTALAYDPEEASLLCAATASGQLWMRAGSAAAVTVTTTGLPPATRLAVSSDASGPTVWMSTSDAARPVVRVGQGVTRSFGPASGLPPCPARTIVLDQGTSPPTVYVGTDVGVYCLPCGDPARSFVPFGQGLPRVPVFDLAVASGLRILGVGTHGRGAWEIPLLPTGSVAPPQPFPGP